MKNLFFDIETTGLPPKDAKYDVNFNEFPHIVQISWWFDNKLNDYIIKPKGYEIPEDAAKIHGITTETALKDGVDADIAFAYFVSDCELAEKIIGHNIYFDISTIKANIRREYENDTEANEIYNLALDKSKRIDTMYKSLKLVGARQKNGSGKFPTLVELYQFLFNESFNAHNSVEDVKATMRCFYELEKIGIIKL